MKLDKITIVGAILALATIGVFALIAFESSFSTFNPSLNSERFINSTGAIGPKDSSFMWTNCTLDLMAQAFVVFTAAAGALAILRISERKGNAND